MNQALLDEFATECRRAVQRLVDEYGFSRERAKRLVFAELASSRAPSPSEVFKVMQDHAVDWDRGYALMSVAVAARDSPAATTREWIHRLKRLEPSGNNATNFNSAARRSMSFSNYNPTSTAAAVVTSQKKRTLSETSIEMEEDITMKRPAQKLIKKE